MKYWIGAIAIFVAVIGFSGCGGGGGTGSGSSGGPVYVYKAVEAVKSGTVIDPMNIVEGETVQFQWAGYTATNQRTVIGSSNWVALAPGDAEGTMSGGGSFTATSSGPAFGVTADAEATQVNGSAQVKATGQALVAGRIVDGYGNFGRTIWVDFYTTGGVKVGESRAQGNGNFRAAVPTTATFFSVRGGSIPTGFYKQFRFNSLWYLPKDLGGLCIAPLPSLTNGVQTNIGDVLVPPTTQNGSSLPPPPPPSPCP